MRKKYDYMGIEITLFHKASVVYYVDCDCGQRATKVYEKYETLCCEHCQREYKLHYGDYVLIETEKM